MKAVGKTLCLLLIAALASSCATPALWEATDPDEFVPVPQDEIDEADLKNEGVEYYRDEEEGVFYVEKGFPARFRDYALRIVLTPVTGAIDSALILALAGAVLAAGYSPEGDTGARERYLAYREAEERKKAYFEENRKKEEMNRPLPLRISP